MAGSKRGKYNRRISKRQAKRCMMIGMIGSLLLVGIIVGSFLWRRTHETSVSVNDRKLTTMFEELKSKIAPIESAAEAFPELGIQEDYLTVNSYSRPGIELSEVDKIVIHYTANPGTGAKANRDYFENLAVTGDTYASSHFVIDLDGTILQCIPLNEIAYASNTANSCCISIECCHPDETGEFSTATYNQCVVLTAALCNYYNLDPQEDVIRHYDVTGKECPLFYVENPDEWLMFLDFVEAYMEQ